MRIHQQLPYYRSCLAALLILLSIAVQGQTVLPAPTNLTATAQAYNSVLLQWRDMSGDAETGFEIYRDPGLGTNFQLIATVGKNVNSYLDQSVEGNQLYNYRVRAVTLRQQSAYSNVASVTTPVPPPSVPSGLAATLSGATSAHLTWEGNNSAGTVFLVERANRTAGGAFTQIAQVDYSRTLSYDDNNLSSGIEYCYRVRAKNESGNSGYSNTSCVTTAMTPPTAPARLTASPTSSSQINLSWADVSDNESGFEIERSTNGTNFSKIADVAANTTSYASVGLNASTRYWYRVRAKNSAGNSGYSNTADATTLAAPVNAPRPPSALSASVSSASQINLTWTDNSDNEDGFELERSGDGTNFTKIADLASNVTSYNNTGLAASTHYWYRIRAKNSGGNSPYSNIAEATTSQVIPAAPARLTASPASFSQINLSWADVSDNESGFEIERSTDATSFSKIADVAANTTSYANDGLNPSTRYWYRVRAKNSIGNSGYSNTADATTLAPPVNAPRPPSALSASASSASQINLTWTDNADNEDGFELERSVDGTNFTKIADFASNVTAYNNTGLVAATHYWYRIRAKNSGGNSPYSNIAEATTSDVAPVAPARLSATAISYQQVDLSWADISSNETAFHLERSTDGTNFSEIANLAANSTSYQDKGVSPLTRYFYRVKASNAIGSSEYSNVAEATTPQAPLPDRPTGLTAIPLDFDLIQLRWSALSSNSVEVVIERSKKPNDEFVQIGKQAASIIQFQDREILDVENYYYRIKATNAAGSSPYSEVVEVPAAAIITGIEPVNDNFVYLKDRILFVKQRLSKASMLTIYDLRGVLIKQVPIYQNPQLDLSSVHQGIYIVEIAGDQKILHYKIAVF